MFNLNGKISPAVTSPPRASRYGDGLFETIRVFDGKTPFWKFHWQRLQQGFRVLKFESPPHFSSDFFQNEILKLVAGQGNHRIRLTVWRSGEGLYAPESNIPVFLVESTPLTGNQFELNDRGLHVGICPNVRLPTAKKATSEQYFLPNVKTCNALPFVIAGIYRRENSLGDCLILNTAGRVACGGSANVFLWKNDSLITPPLFEGCVAGTMRMAMFAICKALKIRILEEKVSRKDLRNADGFFLTNAISGIRWVRKIDGVGKEFSNEKIVQLLAEVNRRISD